MGELLEKLKQKFEPRRIGKLILREAELEDAAELAQLYANNFPEHILVKRGILSDEAELRSELQVENKKWFVSEQDELVGACALEVSEWNEAAEIERVVVAKRLRGNGIGKAMCQYVVDVAEKIGVKYLFAHSRGPEYPMQKIFEDLGFVVSGLKAAYNVVHGTRVVRENFVYQDKLLNGAEDEIESPDRLIPAARDLKETIERHRNKRGIYQKILWEQE